MFDHLVWPRVSGELSVNQLVRVGEGYRPLGELERTILIAIVQQRGQGYAVSIADEASRRLNKSVSLGAIYGTADRLEKKGFISSRLGDPTPERGGKPKRLYKIEARGERALSEVWERSNRTWAGISLLGEPA
jgi:DNA-binding PadR family transcriptional regulator